MSYLGIDIGTAGTKAVVFDINGKTLSSAYIEYKTFSPSPGWYELKPHEVIEKCKQVIRTASEEAAHKRDHVRAIGISSQGEAFTIMDKSGDYISNAIVSFDSRCQKQVEEFTTLMNSTELYTITGHSAHTIFSLFKLLWIKENQGEVFNKMSRILCFGDLLAYKLTGSCAISCNLAARTMLFDIQQLKWSEKILNHLEITKDVLPVPISSSSPVGTLRKEIAAELSLEKNTVVCSGGHDQSCGALGAGVTKSGIAAYSLGTVECVTPVFKGCVLNETLRKSNYATYPYTINGLYTTVAFSLTGGNLLRWFRDTFGRHEQIIAQKTNIDVYDLILKDMPSKPTNLFVLPHFTSTGTPYFDPAPTSAILGLTLNSTRPGIVKAMLEGVAYEIKINMELLKSTGILIDSLRAFGGGAKNDKVLQVKADILGVPIDVLDTNEAGCLGAALLAAKAADDISNLEETVKTWAKPVKTFKPQPSNSEQYNKCFEVYSTLYDSIKPIGTKINSL